MIPKIAFTPEQKVSYDIKKAQEKYAKEATKLSSGKNYQSLKELSEDNNTEDFLLLSAQINSSDSYISSNASIMLRLDSMQESLSQAHNTAIEFAKSLTSRINSASGSSISFKTSISSTFGEIKDAMNSSFNGYYLFSGSKTNVPPVGNIEISNIGQDGSLNDIYYEGDNNILSANINETENLKYGILGNDPTFKKLIASIHLAKEGDETEDYKKLGEALDLLNESLNDLTTLEASVILKKDHLEEVDTNLENSKNFLDEIFLSISDTDIISSSILLQEYESLTQSAMQSFVKLSSLKLSNFL